MRSVVGYSIFAAGLVLAAQAYFPGSVSTLLTRSFTFVSARASHEAVPPAASTLSSTSATAEGSRLSSFSPGSRFLPSKPEAPSDIARFAELAILAGRSGAASAPPPRDVAVKPWRSAVTPVARDMGKPLTVTPSNPSQRYALVRRIQNELKRAGCYAGSIDGSWGPASKRAMAALIERVNATLPLTEPDNILLMLVRSQPSGVCHSPCPAGQARSASHRCAPETVVAEAEKPSATDVAKPVTASVLASAQTSVTDGAATWPFDNSSRNRLSSSARMSVGGPKIEDSPPGEEAIGEATAPESASVAYSDIGEPREAPQSARESAPQRPRRVARSERRYGSSRGMRSVQHLFQHPLGM